MRSVLITGSVLQNRPGNAQQSRDCCLCCSDVTLQDVQKTLGTAVASMFFFRMICKRILHHESGFLKISCLLHHHVFFFWLYVCIKPFNALFFGMLLILLYLPPFVMSPLGYWCSFVSVVSSPLKSLCYKWLMHVLLYYI